MSGMLLFLCLISTCFCQTMLISSSVIRSLFAWIMDNLLMYQENRIICTRKNATDKSLTTEATRASPSHKHLPLLQVGYWAGRLKRTRFKVYFRHKHAFWLFSDCGTLSRVEQVCQAYHEVQYCLSLTAVNEGASSYNVIKDVL